MLKLFETYHYLTVKQVCDLLGATERRDEGGKLTRKAVQSRLKKMKDAQYLKRTPVAHDPTVTRLNPITEWSYRLSELGRRVVSEGKYLGEKSPVSASHEQDITAFHLALAQFPGKIFWEQTNLRRTVNPDAMFGLSKDGKMGYYFFLEMERSKQAGYEDEPGHSNLTAKLEKYEAYRGTEQCKIDWQFFSDFRVIVIVKDNPRKPGARANNLLQKLAGRAQYGECGDFRSGWGQTITHPPLPYRYIWVATDRAFLEDPMGQIFRTPKDYLVTSYSLPDLYL